VDVARAAQALPQRTRLRGVCAACAPRVAPSFLKWKEFLKYSIFNIQSLQDIENIPIQFFAPKCTKITTKVLRLRAIIVNSLLHLPSAPNLCYKKNIGAGALKISECGLRIADFEWAICLIFQSAIRNLKSAIDFAPILQE